VARFRAHNNRCYSASIDVSDSAGVGWKVVGRHGCYGRGAGLTSGNERVKWAGVPFFYIPLPPYLHLPTHFFARSVLTKNSKTDAL
jgi:hypothetical protein